MRAPSSRLPLRARAAIAFGVGALLLSASLATLTYALCRSYLVDQREATATDQTYLNARLVRSLLRTEQPDVPAVLSAADRAADSSSVLHYSGDWFASSVAAGEESLPSSLRDAVATGRAGRQRFELNGVTQLAVGVPVAEAGAGYFQVFTLAELRRTLTILRTSLTIAAVMTTIGGAAVGYWASRRLLKPVREMAAAAGDIAGGQLEMRLQEHGDRDLDPLTASFNEMVDALQARIEREARFASDVSHELRTPLAALAAGIDVVQRRREDLPERAGMAVDVLQDQIGTFERLVLDLLEVSRFDAGIARLDVQQVELERFVAQVIEVSGCAPVEIRVEPGVDTAGIVDRRRLRQVITNLLENAAHYGGGATLVRISGDDEVVQIAVEDRGPGVAAAEREEVFDRFARGAEGRRRGTVKGSGLGLALVTEHVRLHGGQVWVEDNEGGGACFVIRLPRNRA